METRYSEHDIAVSGGTLHLGVWAAEHPTAETTTVLAIHGVTSNHLAWRLLAEAFPEVTFLVPDLRGRGRSSALPAPYGMTQHGEDLKAILEHFGVEKAIVAGHSMGAFVALIFADRYPEFVESLLLIDGGLPIMVPGNLRGEELLRAVLGPVADRLAQVFTTRADYIDYWKKHPAFQEGWSDFYSDYADYDLNEVAGGFQPSTNYEAMKYDSADLYDSDLLVNSLDNLRQHAIFLRSPLGLFAEPPGLFSPEQIQQASERYPRFDAAEISSVNHYTIVMSHEGVAQVSQHLQQLIDER
ncbi:MAG: alpha/beta hydrolase, partial [Microbacteriaceae bacterium]